MQGNTTQPSAQNDPAVVKYEGPTPGTWEWANDEVFVEETNTSICMVLQREPHSDANARLIAAAPDMLAALQCALFDLEQTYSHVSSVSADRIKNDTIPLCRAAIAKATTPRT